MKKSRNFIISIIALSFFLTFFIIIVVAFYPSISQLKNNQINSTNFINQNINKIKNDYLKNHENQLNLSGIFNQNPILTSDSNAASFIYQYKSNNYYGTLEITDYQPPISGFNEFQKPNNVNIKGIPWEDSQFILSFVFPVYNKIKFLDRVFKSILDFANNPTMNPLNKKFEFVIVDANSDDGSYEYAINLSKKLNNPSYTNKHQQNHQKKSVIHKVQNQFNEQNSINSVISSFLTGNKIQSQKKKIRYRNALISFHNQEQTEKQSSNSISSSSLNSEFDISSHQGSNVKVRVVRRSETTLSIIARQIAVEYATGRYIWQIDPDDEVETSSIAAIVDELRKEIEDPNTFIENKINSNEYKKDNNDDNNNDYYDYGNGYNNDNNKHFNRKEYIKQFENLPSNDIERKSQSDPPADIIDIGYCQYTFQDGVLPETPNCFPRFPQRIDSNYKIAERLITATTSWQLWQCIIKRDTFLKAIESIKLHAPNQTKIIVADDLFIYSAATYHAKVLKEVNLIGYIYYYMNPNSESLKIYKDNLNTRLSAKVIVTFMHYLYDGMKLEFNQRYSEL